MIDSAIISREKATNSVTGVRELQKTKIETTSKQELVSLEQDRSLDNTKFNQFEHREPNKYDDTKYNTAIDEKNIN